jgi:hypothetical protein
MSPNKHPSFFLSTTLKVHHTNPINQIKNNVPSHHRSQTGLCEDTHCFFRDSQQKKINAFFCCGKGLRETTLPLVGHQKVLGSEPREAIIKPKERENVNRGRVSPRTHLSYGRGVGGTENGRQCDSRSRGRRCSAQIRIERYVVRLHPHLSCW